MGVDWLDGLEEVGGLLVPAARVFVDSQHPPMPAAGVLGIRWLAAQLEDFVDRNTDDTEGDRFVEGAGALLGLLLIEHMGGRTHEHEGRHRVQLGRYGWFDPFGAIQAALDDEDPRMHLSELLSVAEREAEGMGPIARVVRVFTEVLDRERPDLAIEAHFELTVELDNGATVDLSRLERVSRDQGDVAMAEAARRIISLLPGSERKEETPWAEASTRLFPRLLSEQFLASLPAEQPLYVEPLGHDVHLALQLRYGTRARYVRPAEVDGWMLEPATARAQAIANLSRRSRTLRVEAVSESIFRVRNGDALDGARLLLPDLAARLAHLGSKPWIAAAPHRDVLLLGQEPACQELARRAVDAARRAPHPVSPSLFAITAHGPRAWHTASIASH